MKSESDNGLLDYFTNVEDLRELFQDWVNAPTLTKRLIVIHGVGGVGKSSLLSIFRLYCKGKKVPVGSVSGDHSKSILEVLAHWVEDLKAEDVTFPLFTKTMDRYRSIQAKVGKEAEKSKDTSSSIANIAQKAVSKTAETTGGALLGAALGSIIPGLGTAIGGTLGGVLAGMSTDAVLDWLRRFLKDENEFDLLLDPTKRLTADFIKDIDQNAKRKRVVLLLDTFEHITTLEDWLSELAQSIHPNVVIVIAGRKSPDWAITPEWITKAHFEELRPMPDAKMRELIHGYYATMRGGEPDPEQVEALIRFAQGLPLIATSAVQLWVKYKHDAKSFLSLRPEIVANLVDRLMSEVPSILIPALEGAAILRSFDQSILRAVMGQEDIRDAYNELRKFSFVRSDAHGLALHDLVREIIAENLRLQDPEHYSELHERAATYFESRMEKSPASAIERFEMERLYHKIQVDEEVGIRIFQQFAESLTRYRLNNRLRGLLNDLNSYKHQLHIANTRLWLEYYEARLSHREGYAEAETMYQRIVENVQSESRLVAYALCDWGEILVKDENLPQVGGSERALQILERARQIVDIDAKLVFVFTHLSRVYAHQGSFQRAIDALQQQLEFYREHDDQIGIVDTLVELRWTYGRWGNWKEALEAASQAQQIILKFPQNSFIKAKLIAYAYIPLWAGRYQATEHQIRDVLGYAIRENDLGRQINLGIMLGYTLGLQHRFGDAVSRFTAAFELIEKHNLYNEWAPGMGFLGHTLIKRGEFDKAEENLKKALSYKRKNRDDAGIPEILNWLGELFEIQHDWQNARSYYEESLATIGFGRHNFECSALIGLARVRYVKKDEDSARSLLARAQLLAQQYEYNDHLSAICLMYAQLAPSRAEALRQFKLALIYALRFNRFLLDEILSGKHSALNPTIPQLLKRGEEGKQILRDLQTWWGTGMNETGESRPDSISSIHEGIPLLEAESKARQFEIGDGSPQKTVIQQIDKILGVTS